MARVVAFAVLFLVIAGAFVGEVESKSKDSPASETATLNIAPTAADAPSPSSIVTDGPTAGGPTSASRPSGSA